MNSKILESSIFKTTTADFFLLILNDKIGICNLDFWHLNLWTNKHYGAELEINKINISISRLWQTAPHSLLSLMLL